MIHGGWGRSLVHDGGSEQRCLGVPLLWGAYALSWIFSLGDSQYKRFGVTPEPDVKTRIIEGHSATALVLMSDGISSLLSYQEVADLVQTCAKLGPEVASRVIVRFAEGLGAEDNRTAVVVPLNGWNTRVKDITKVPQTSNSTIQAVGLTKL